MLDSSSQMIIDSSTPQARPASQSSSTMNNSDYSNSPPFSDALHKAENSVEPKSSANDNSQQTKAKNNSANSVKQQGKNETQQNVAAKKSTEQKPVEKTNSDDKSQASNTNDTKSAKKTDARQKKDKSKNDSTAQDGNVDLNIKEQTAQAQKNLGFNPLQAANSDGTAKNSISQDVSEKNADASLQKTQGSDSKGKTKTSLHDLVSKILDDQAGDGKNKKATQAENDASSAGQTATDKTAAIAKAIAFDFKNVLKDGVSKSNKVTDLKNSLTKDNKDQSISSKKIDEFVSKILDRLNLTKDNLGTILHTKSSHEGISVQSDISAQSNQKLSVDMLGQSTSMMTGNSVSQRPNTTAQMPQLMMNTNINQPEWGSEFGKRIQYMMNNHIQTAELRLDPPNLGHIHIKINMSSDQAHITFSSAHQVVRDSIESTMPRLREMMAESGLQLGNTDVASHFQQNTREQTFTSSNMSGPVMPDSEEDIVSNVANTTTVHYSANGMIDYFA